MALNCSSQHLWLPGTERKGTFHHISLMGRLLSWSSPPPSIRMIPRQGLLGSLGLYLPPGTSSQLWLLELICTLPVLPATAEDNPSFP